MMNALRVVVRWVLGVVFCYAGLAKAVDRGAFAVDIDHYRLLPFSTVAPLALYLPWLEIAAGVAVIAGPLRRGGLLTLALLNAVFAVAIGSALMRGIEINCGCFGPGLSLPLWLGLLRNLVLGGASVWLLHAHSREIAMADSA